MTDNSVAKKDMKERFKVKENISMYISELEKITNIYLKNRSKNGVQNLGNTPQKKCGRGRIRHLEIKTLTNRSTQKYGL